MKKSTKIYLYAWGVLAAAIIGFIIYPSHHDKAKIAKNIEKIVKVDLPDIAESKSTDNIDRCASRWDIFNHSILFNENISEKCIKELDSRCKADSTHWSKSDEKGCYTYHDEGGIDNLYEVWCTIHKDHATISYMIDEDEGILMFFTLFICVNIMLLWGLVLGIIAIVRRRTR